MTTQLRLMRATRPPEPFHYGFRFGRSFAPTGIVLFGTDPDGSDDSRVNLAQSATLNRPSRREEVAYCFGNPQLISMPGYRL
jgi:hypothetical protein